MAEIATGMKTLMDFPHFGGGYRDNIISNYLFQKGMGTI